MSKEIRIPATRAVLGVDAVVAILILVGSIFALMAGNNIRTIADETKEMYGGRAMKDIDRAMVDLLGNCGWFVVIFGMAGIVYGIKRLVDNLTGVSR